MNNFLIKKDYSNLKTLVINLDDYKDNYDKQLPYLESLGLNVERFVGINAIKDEHLKPEYSSYISNFAYYFQPKSVIGISLSHILCCKYIYLNYIEKYDYFLILEDDAYPIYNKKDFNDLLNTNLKNIEILNKDWDIIQLHSDAFFPNYETYNTHALCGSTAAYLISKKGMEKTLKEKIYSHADFIQHNFLRYNKYRVKSNLFYTNEENSLNRVIEKNYSFNNISLYSKTKLIEFINNYLISIPLRGEKKYNNFLEFKIFKLPYFKKEYTFNELIDYLLSYLLIKKLYIKYNH